MEKSNGYVGKVKNSGTQMVKAPFGGGSAKKGDKRITGEDLRVNKTNGTKKK